MQEKVAGEGQNVACGWEVGGGVTGACFRPNAAKVSGDGMGGRGGHSVRGQALVLQGHSKFKNVDGANYLFLLFKQLDS